MAAKKYFVDIDLNKNQLLNTVLENTTEALAAVNQTLGQIIFDTGSKTLKYFDGAKWQSSETRLEGALQYKGPIAHDSKITLNAQKGDLYIFNSPPAGTSAESTLFGGAIVEKGDFAIWNGATWDIIQGNTVEATDEQKGVVELATQADFNSEAANVAITPANISAWANPVGGNKSILRKEVISSVTIKTDGSTLISYTLPSGNPTVRVYDFENNEIEVAIENVNGQIKLTSNSEISNTTVVVMA